MQPANEPRGDLNPYASPQEAGGYEERTPYGIGVWRDGCMLVMHKEARLPPICIHSGHPATAIEAYEVAWHAAGRFLPEKKSLPIPLCDKRFGDYARLHSRTTNAGWLLAAASLGTFFAASNEGAVAAFVLTVAALLALCAVTLWLHAYWTFGHPLSVAWSSGDYLWLRDVHGRMLQHVPPWVP
jgi:hypothetical protein